MSRVRSLSAQPGGTWRARSRMTAACSGRLPKAVSALVISAISALAPQAARAQAFEQAGTRALGMGGAFVAVADDATAPWWNPAGLWTGAWMDLRVDGGSVKTTPEARNSFLYFGFVVPPLGVTCVRTERTFVAGPAGTGVAASLNRHNDRSSRVQLASLASQHLGATFVQSVLDEVAIGTTLRLVRAEAARGTAEAGTSSAELLAQAARLPGKVSHAFDLDVGAMARFPGGRVGAVVRNLRSPAFEPLSGGEALEFRRQARVGIVLTPGRREPVTAAREPGGWTIAFDLDLTRNEAPTGDVRMAAAGAERWLAGGLVGVRAGVRASTLGAARPVAAAGFSFAVRANVLVEAQVTAGHGGGDRGWSVAGRAAF